MKHEEEPMNDYRSRMKEYLSNLVKQEIISLGEETKRDYKAEYKKFQSSTKSKKYRAELNQYNRKKGTYGNGDGKDASHKGGKIVGFESQSKNRGRAEKSRLKKEVTLNENPVAIAATQGAIRAMKNVKVQGKSGNKISAVTALKDKTQPSHNRAKSVFSKLFKKFKNSKKQEPKKQSQSDIDFYKKQFTGESINEEMYFDPKSEFKKYMDKVFKQSKIKVIKFNPMKQSFHNGAWGGFYTVKSDNKVDMPGQGKVKRGSAVLPVYISKKATFVELGIRAGGFKLGKVGSSQVVKNLKDFKKGDLDEVVIENKEKIKQYFIKKGDNEKDANDKLRFYDVVKKLYKGAPPAKRAEIMSSLWANESVNEGIFGKFDTGAGFKGNGMTVYDRNQEKAGDYKDIAHIAPNGKITIYDKKVKKEPKLMKSLNKISQEFKKTFKESVNENLLKQIKQAEKIAKSMSGNMTGAVKGIEKIRRGLSRHKRVRVALRKYNESVNEVNMAHVYSKDLNKKKFKDLGLYLAHVLDLAPNKDFRLTSNKKLLAINIDKINPKSLQNIKKRFGIDLKQKAKEPIRLKSKSGMGKISHLGIESVKEGVSKSQAQEIMRQLGGRKFEMLMGVKSKSVGTDGLILHIGKNPKKVSHIIIDLNRDEYDLTFGKVFKYNWKVIKKVKGVGVEQLHDMIEKYTGNLTTFRPRK
jgi:hypothetical protein